MLKEIERPRFFVADRYDDIVEAIEKMIIRGWDKGRMDNQMVLCTEDNKLYFVRGCKIYDTAGSVTHVHNPEGS